LTFSVGVSSPAACVSGWSKLQPDALFVWGRRDRLVPSAFARHVADVLPGARHLELDCGHVPQVKLPRQTHAAVAAFPSERSRRRAPPVESGA